MPVIAPKDGQAPPVWRGNPGDRAHVKPSVKPWLDDSNAAEAAYAPGKGAGPLTVCCPLTAGCAAMHPQYVGVDGGVGSVVFGGHPSKTHTRVS